MDAKKSAKYLGISLAMFYKLVSSGEIKPIAKTKPMAFEKQTLRLYKRKTKKVGWIEALVSYLSFKPVGE